MDKVERRFPERVQKTGMGWSDERSAYKVQIGTHSQTIAYAWAPSGVRRDDDVIADAVEVANRLCEGWNSHTTIEALQAQVEAMDAEVKAAFDKGVAAALDSARGTNADMCKTASDAYRIMQAAIIRVNDPLRAAVIQGHVRTPASLGQGEG